MLRHGPEANCNDCAERGQAVDLRQEVNFCTTGDGARIACLRRAWLNIGKTDNWLNHLEFDWERPDWTHLPMRALRQYRLVDTMRAAMVCLTGTWMNSRSRLLWADRKAWSRPRFETICFIRESQGLRRRCCLLFASPRKSYPSCSTAGFIHGKRPPAVRPRTSNKPTLCLPSCGRAGPGESASGKFLPRCSLRTERRNKCNGGTNLQRKTTSPENAVACAAPSTISTSPTCCRVVFQRL